MKRFAPILFSYCLLLTVVGSCKKPALEEPEPNLANCRIVKETTKRVDGFVKDTPETILVEGKSFIINTQSIQEFQYDDAGRIVRRDNKVKTDFWTTYSYAPNEITEVARAIHEPDGVVNITTKIPLNAQRLDARFQYDTEGYPIDSLNYKGELISKRKDGNIVESRESIHGGIITDTYTYDLSKPNLPNIYPFKGKQNRNLVMQNIGTSFDIPLWQPGELYRINTYYNFDQYGRVKRKIQYLRNDYNSGYPYVSSEGEIIVTDYEYECS